MNSPPGNVRVAVCTAILTICVPCCTRAQAVAAQRRFDVSTVRTSNPDAGNASSVSLDSQRLTARNVTLARLISLAYGLSEDQLSGGPSWITSRRFDITAKADTPVDPKLSPVVARQIQKEMMQRLLGERFQLKIRHERKAIPGYLLTAIKTGPKGMQKDDSDKPGMVIDDEKLRATAITMDQFADALSQGVLHRPVTNATSLTGKFDLQLTWDRRTDRYEGGADAPSDLGPSIFVSLQQQLGLKLEQRKTDADAIAVESAQIPQAN